MDGVPSGVNAFTDDKGLEGIVVLAVVSGALELAAWRQEDSKEPGNFGDPFEFSGPLGPGTYTAEWRNKELSNGRFAMIAVLGIFAAELSTGKDAMEQLSGLSALDAAAEGAVEPPPFNPAE